MALDLRLGAFNVRPEVTLLLLETLQLNLVLSQPILPPLLLFPLLLVVTVQLAKQLALQRLRMPVGQLNLELGLLLNMEPGKGNMELWSWEAGA